MHYVVIGTFSAESFIFILTFSFCWASYPEPAWARSFIREVLEEVKLNSAGWKIKHIAQKDMQGDVS